MDGMSLDPTLKRMVLRARRQLGAREREGLDDLLARWPRQPNGAPDRSEALREGLAALLDQARVLRRADLPTSLKQATIAGCIGCVGAFLAALILEVTLRGSGWAAFLPPTPVVAGIVAAALAVFGFWQAVRPSRLSRGLFAGLTTLPVGCVVGGVAALALGLGLEATPLSARLQEAPPAVIALALAIVSLASGLLGAALAMHRAWRRWDQDSA
jgi:hypothetical protein